ncbi:gp113 [Erwinia phage vB_EamP-S6]|uniref:Gp113 n=1 Tax=Erwinia phage vB_EamP-S6 TaxID=1051675 RepID=G0YQK5_9CAUD|nr:gp113 [Erwinia phage vB_EamP-S6]AEJ81632.1 gp113 [Erwinia phage vB_EamP-S6]
MKLTELILLRVEGGEMSDMTLAAYSWINMCREQREIRTTSIVKIKALCRTLNQQ